MLDPWPEELDFISSPSLGFISCRSLIADSHPVALKE